MRTPCTQRHREAEGRGDPWARRCMDAARHGLRPRG